MVVCSDGILTIVFWIVDFVCKDYELKFMIMVVCLKPFLFQSMLHC